LLLGWFLSLPGGGIKDKSLFCRFLASFFTGLGGGGGHMLENILHDGRHLPFLPASAGYFKSNIHFGTSRVMSWSRWFQLLWKGNV
jgi:hypothetical protein